MNFRLATLICLLLMTAAQARAQTQEEINQKAVDEAAQVKQKVDKCIRTLSSTYAKTKGFKAKLDESQELWNNFVEAHINAIFPVPKGQDYRELYGSINGLCVGDYRKELTEVRLAELKAWTKLPPKRDLATLKSEYDKADKALNSTYAKVMHSPARTGKTGPQFIRNLVGAEVAWIAFRNTDSEVYGLTAGSKEFCFQKMIDLTKSRTNQLNKWLEGVEEGDTCGGSYPLKK